MVFISMADEGVCNTNCGKKQPTDLVGVAAPNGPRPRVPTQRAVHDGA